MARVTSNKQCPLCHASLEIPEGNTTLCPLTAWPQRPNGDLDDLQGRAGETRVGSSTKCVCGFMCVCVRRGQVWASARVSQGLFWQWLQAAAHSDRTSVAWDAPLGLRDPGAGVVHRQPHWSGDPWAHQTPGQDHFAIHTHAHTCTCTRTCILRHPNDNGFRAIRQWDTNESEHTSTRGITELLARKQNWRWKCSLVLKFLGSMQMVQCKWSEFALIYCVSIVVSMYCTLLGQFAQHTMYVHKYKALKFIFFLKPWYMFPSFGSPRWTNLFGMGEISASLDRSWQQYMAEGDSPKPTAPSTSQRIC